MLCCVMFYAVFFMRSWKREELKFWKLRYHHALNARSSTPVAPALARSSCTRTIPIARRTITYSPLSLIAYYLTTRQTYPTFIVTCLMHHRSKLTFLLLTDRAKDMYTNNLTLFVVELIIWLFSFDVSRLVGLDMSSGSIYLENIRGLLVLSKKAWIGFFDPKKCWGIVLSQWPV
jgi:hypothetical protein